MLSAAAMRSDGDFGTGLRLLGIGASQHHGAEVPRLAPLPDRASERGVRPKRETELVAEGSDGDGPAMVQRLFGSASRAL